MKPALVLSLLFAVRAAAIPVFIGTDGRPDSGGRGIYRCDFDPVSGQLGEVQLAAECASPGFLALHPEKPILYAISRPSKPDSRGHGAVLAFTITAGHGLRFLGESTSAGKGPCHLAVDATGRTVAVANYGDGGITTLRLGEDGVPEADPVSVIRNTGKGPNPARQNGPHAHGVYFDQANRHLFVPDLGLDKVLVHPFDPATSKLGDPLPPLVTAPGAGPRHMAFSPDETHAYVINELDCTILAASYRNGAFQEIGVSKTLPADFTGPNTTAEIEVSADGRFVYASNRGHESIAVFSRHPDTGALAFIQHAPCGGETPRHFKISPCGGWLLCGHQKSNTIGVLPRDPRTGRLGAPVDTQAAPGPICILFPR